jgi:alkanesulfonate monooxygenase SsuD/methylene tetrahydromethanopterin reductase-like flavin-dependent oxidoreductase (luciferase family)
MPDWGTPGLIQRGLSKIKEFAKKHARKRKDFQVAFSTAFHLADSDEEAFRKTAKLIKFSELEATIVAKYCERTPRNTIEKTLIGSKTTILSRIESYVNVGVSHFSLIPLTKDIETTFKIMEAFSRDIAS